MDIVSLLLIFGLVLGSIIFLVFVILSAKTWHWLHVLACLFAYSMAITAMVFMAAATKTVNAWKQVAHDNAEKLAEREASIEMFTKGEITDPTYTETSIIARRNALERESIGRGRVWRSVKPGNIPNDWSSITVSSQVRALAADGEDPPPAGFPAEDTVLFVFSERPFSLPVGVDGSAMIGASQVNQFLTPSVYLGEFRVVASGDDSMTLTPVRYGAASTDQYNAARNQTWVCYEVMPIDRQDIFDDLMTLFDAPGIDEPADLTVDQLVQRRRVIENFFANSGLPFQPGTVEFEAFVDRYAFDGLTLTKIRELIDADQANRINSTFEPTMDETWVLIEFTTSGSYQVDVAEESLNAGGDSRVTGLEGSAFDSAGRARARNLRQGGEDSTYDEGDQLVVDVYSAVQGYQDLDGNNIEPLVPGKAKEIDRVYRRSMADFQYFFASTDQHLLILERDMARILADITMLEASHASADATQAKWEQQVDEYVEDNQHFNADVEMVASYRADLENSLAEKRDLYNRLYGLSVSLANQKAELQKQITAQIESQTQDALDDFEGE